MAKDPVCGMNVDELKTQYISEINGEKVFMS
jgi:YHS domain-containing protein